MLHEPSVTRSQLARVIRKASDHMLTDGYQRWRISPRALLWSLGAWSVRYGLALWLATNDDATAAVEQGVLESFAIVAGVSAHARSAPQWRHLPRLELDRQARSTRDLLDTMETISEAGARFQSLSEPWPTPQLMLVADYDRVCCHQSLNAT
jgi:hypothetical protein